MNELIRKRIKNFKANPSYENYAHIAKFGIGLYVLNNDVFIPLKTVDLKELDCSNATPLYDKTLNIYGVWVNYK